MRSYLLSEIKYVIHSWWRKWARPLTRGVIAAAIAISSVFVSVTPEGQGVDHWLLRRFFEFRGSRSQPSDVVIVAIDDRSYQELGASPNFPLPRKYIADALEAIEAAGPIAIIFDANLPAQPNFEPEADERIESALRNGPTSIWTGEIPPEDSSEKSSTVIIPSDERFRRAAKMELPMAVAGEDEVVLYVSYGTALDATLYERVPIARALVELAHLAIEAPGPNDLINFYGPKDSITHVSLSRFLGDHADSTAKDSVRGKVVLVGYHSQHRGRGVINKDEYEVPASSTRMFGVEIHGTIIGNLMDRSWLHQPDENLERDILLLAVILTASIGLFLRGSAAPITVACFAAVATVLEYCAFAFERVWIAGIGSYLLGCAVTFVAIGVFGIWSTERFRRYIDRVLGFETEQEL